MKIDDNKSVPVVNPIHPEIFRKSAVPPKGVKLEENVYVTMRDGVKIAVDVYLPETEGRYPALFSMSPYMKEIQQRPPQWSHSIEAGATGFIVPKGYVHVIAQSRGSGLSQGQYQFYNSVEQQDGYELIEWAAGQTWCNGKVGMMGDSYFARTQFLIALQQPPHLKCIAPYDGSNDVYRDSYYQGGVYNASFGNNWGTDTTFMCVWPGSVEGKLPPMNWSAELASHPFDGPFWWERTPWRRLGEIEVPMMSIVPQGAFHHSRGQLWGYPRVKSPKKLIVAPQAGFWSHVRLITNLAINEHLLRWYDYWLKGIDTGIMEEPEVAIFDSTTRKWRYENEYPVKRTGWTKFYLRSNPAGTAGEPPYGSISPDAPGNEEPERYRIPDATEKLLAGKPVLAFETDKLEHDLRVWGPLSMALYGSSTSPDTVWFVYLFDISPEGKPDLLTRGILKASFREVDASLSGPGQPFHPFLKQEPLEPKKIYDFQIEMWPLFHVFKAGHRIRVQIANDDLNYYPILHTLDIQLQPWPAENALYHDSAHPSHLLLPVVPDAPEIKPVTPPLSDVDWPMLDGHWWPVPTGWPLLAEE